MVLQSVKYKAFTRDNIEKVPQFQLLPAEIQRDIRVVSAVFPFRTNRYIVDHQIDWNDVPNDPIYQLTFPQRDMLSEEDYNRVAALIDAEDRNELKLATRDIQMAHNPHPAGQQEYNVPHLNGEPLPGLQHKYDETVLFFPSQGQTCHAYCSYCFRWAQFIGMQDLKFASREAGTLAQYLCQHTEVSDILFTGGDPAIMKTKALRAYIEPLLAPELEHVQTIRIGTKAISYWPYRFVTDDDADDLLRLFEEIAASGRHVAIMAHYSHTREMEPEIAHQAVQRLRDVGCEIRMQAPLMKHINDDPDVWAEMWRYGTRQGLIPYYMFVSRDTGPRGYFELSLFDAFNIFQGAYQQVSGLARTVRGPVMSATPGKVMVNGIANVAGQQVFVLSFLQGRNPAWVGRPFFARFDPEASWLFDLEPAFSNDGRFFYEREFAEVIPLFAASGD
jgi:KamA family protein